MAGALDADDRIARVAQALAFDLREEARRAIAHWVELVDKYNAKIDLTAARSHDELVDLMVADAFVLAARIREGASVVDVGSGAGAPGLPLAIARPDLDVLLVEPREKRASFLRTACASAGVAKRPRVERAKGEDVAKRGDRFDVAISRATLAPAEWLAVGSTLAPEVWALVARKDPPVVSTHRVALDYAYAWPLTGAARRAVAYVPDGDAGERLIAK